MEIRPTSYAEVAYLSTIRVLAHKKSGVEAAAAFLIHHEESSKSFVVTARHVTEEAASITLHFYSGEKGPDLGGAVAYEIRGSSFWQYHDDPAVDVAVGPMQPIDEFFAEQNRPFFAASIPRDWFEPAWVQPPPSPFDGFRRPFALDEVLIVGYPNDYRDNPTSLPLLRRGTLATPLWLDHEGRPVFLVDTAASHGTSGGPIFFVQENQKVGNTMYGGSGKLILLGIFSEVLPPKSGTAPAGAPLRPPNLGAGYKAHTILDVVRRYQ